MPRIPEGRAPPQSRVGPSVDTRPSPHSQKHTWDPAWSLKAAVMNQSKATNEHTMPARAWPTRHRGSGCVFQLGVGETRPGLPACWGPTPAAPAHFRVGLTVHGADGRFQHPALGPRAPSRGRCARRDPRQGSSHSPAERRSCSPCIASTAGSVFLPLRRRMLRVLHLDRPGAASTSRRTAERSTRTPGQGRPRGLDRFLMKGQGGVHCPCPPR